MPVQTITKTASAVSTRTKVIVTTAIIGAAGLAAALLPSTNTSTFDYKVSLDKTAITVVAGNTLTSTITVTPISGTPSLVTFSAGTNSTTLNPSFSPASCTPSNTICTSIMTVPIPTTHLAGDYYVNVDGRVAGTQTVYDSSGNAPQRAKIIITISPAVTAAPAASGYCYCNSALTDEDSCNADCGLTDGWVNTTPVASTPTAPSTTTTITDVPPTPGKPDMTAASDLGSSNTDNITPDNTPSFEISCQTGNTVTLLDNLTNVPTQISSGSNICPTSSVITLTSSTLSNGSHVISALQAYQNGRSSTASPVLSITIDTTAATPTPAPAPVTMRRTYYCNATTDKPANSTWWSGESSYAQTFTTGQTPVIYTPPNTTTHWASTGVINSCDYQCTTNANALTKINNCTNAIPAAQGINTTAATYASGDPAGSSKWTQTLNTSTCNLDPATKVCASACSGRAQKEMSVTTSSGTVRTCVNGLSTTITKPYVAADGSHSYILRCNAATAAAYCNKFPSPKLNGESVYQSAAAYHCSAASIVSVSNGNSCSGNSIFWDYVNGAWKATTFICSNNNNTAISDVTCQL